MEKVKTRINTEILLGTLDKAADMVRQSPAEVSCMLMGLSKLLRMQLYESEHMRYTLLSEFEQLQRQVNSHFLFNMLNNIIVLTKKDPDKASDVICKLSDILKYRFSISSKQTIRLGDGICFLNDFLDLEKLRRDNFEFSITSNNEVEEISLPPLLFLSFVENAVKHSKDNHNLSFVRIEFSRLNDKLCFECINSKPLCPIRKDEVGGLGLPNARRRLDLLYGNRYHLDITENDTNYSVQLIIEL